jgi:uncharacterized protein (TIGR00369 family)
MAVSQSDPFAHLHARIASIPIFETLGFHSFMFGAGTCAVVVPRRRQYDGIFQSFHGGILLTAADSAAALAVLTLAGAEARITTTDMSIRFLSACLTDVTVHARVVKFGRTLVPLTVDLRDAAGKDVAMAQVTYMRLSLS